MKKTLYGIYIILAISLSTFLFTQDTALYANPKKQSSNALDSQTLFDIFHDIATLNWDVHLISLGDAKSFNRKELLLDKKNTLLESLPSLIINIRQPIGLSSAEITQQRKQQELILNDAQIQHDDYNSLVSNITLNSLILDEKMLTLLMKLRKESNFFSQRFHVDSLISQSLQEIKTLPNNFEIPATLSLQQTKQIQNMTSHYLNKLATYTEIITYFKWNIALLIPQNMILHTTIHWILEKLENNNIDYFNLLTLKIILSLLSFVVLWACRKLITRFIMYIMDIITHLTNQDKALHNSIQKDILKPVSLFLLAWSLNVSIGILYYPIIEPDFIAVWFNIIYIINIAWFVIALIKGYWTPLLTNLAQKTNERFRKEIVNLILKISYSIVIIIALLFILKYLGFNISTIIASLGLGGLAVALAIKDILANFFASVMLLFDNSFSQGDWIECGSVEGSVVEIGLRRTTIRTSENALLFVPNSELASKVIQNWSRRKSGRRIKMSVGVAYNASQEQLQECVKSITTMLITHSQIATESNISREESYNFTLRRDIISIDDYLGYKHGLYVYVESLGDSSINILVDCFTRSVSKKEFLEVKQDIILKIMGIVKDCNLAFAFPSQSLYVETLPLKI